MRRNRCVRLGILTALAFATAARAAIPTPPEDWPRFRGPNGSGISTATNLPIVFGPETNLAWKVQTPAGSSSPVVANDHVFITGFDGDRLLTICLDLQTGQTGWQKELPATRPERKTSPNDAASSTPATDGTNIYALFSSFGLVAYSVDGEEKWRKPLGPFNPPHGMASSLILVQGKVILVADQVSQSHIVAFDSTKGQEKWRTPRGDFVGGYTTPIVFHNDIVVSGPLEMIAYSPESGARLWSSPRMGVMPIASPICDGDRLFAYNDAVPPFQSLTKDFKADRNGDGRIDPDEFPDPSFKEAVLAIDRNFGNGDGAIDQKEWDGALQLMKTMNALVAVRVEANRAAELWRTSKLLTDAASPLLYRNVLYFVRSGGLVTTLDPATGAVLRETRVASFDGAIFASPVAAEGRIYLANASGRIAVLETGAEPRTLVVNRLNEHCYATPALVSGLVLVRTEHSLWAFRQKSSS